MMKLSKAMLGLVFVASVLSGCSSGPGRGDVSYSDPTSVDTTNINFGSTDLQSIADKMVAGMLTFPPIVELTATKRPIIVVDAFQNQTNESINTDDINNMVMTRLLQSGKFRFVDVSAAAQVKQQLSYQKDSGLVDPAKAIKAGRQVGAEYMLYGSISNIIKENKKERSVYYLVTMKLLNLDTGIIEWADQKQIRKTQK